MSRIDAVSGVSTTIAGTGVQGFSGDGGPAVLAQLYNPSGIAIDSAGNLFISDTQNQRIRRIDALSGTIMTVVGKPLTTDTLGRAAGGFSGDGLSADRAQLNRPTAIMFDHLGNLLIVDGSNHRVRKVDAVTGVITTVAGTGIYGFSGDGGSAIAAQLAYPSSIAVDNANNLLIADRNNRRIRKVDAVTGVITTVAGTGVYGFSGDGGSAIAAQLAYPSSIAVDNANNLLIADRNNQRIRKVDAVTGIITTVAGTGVSRVSGDGGPAIAAQLYYPSSIAIDNSGYFLLNNRGNIRRVDAATNIITTVPNIGRTAGLGDGGLTIYARVREPESIAIDQSGNIYIATERDHRVRKVDAATGIITTVAGTGARTIPASGNGDGGPAILAVIPWVEKVAVDNFGNLYIADERSDRIRKVDMMTGVISTVAGTGASGFSGDGGPATLAQLSRARGMAFDSMNNLYIADTRNHRIRKVDALTGVITTIAGTGALGSSGDGGPAILATFTRPESITIDAADNLLIVANNRVRKVDALTGMITTIAGGGSFGFWSKGLIGDGGFATSARLKTRQEIVTDGANNLFIADDGNSRIRRVDVITGIITTVAGTGIRGLSGDGGPATLAMIDRPYGLALDGIGNLYFSSGRDDNVRKIEGIAAINIAMLSPVQISRLTPAQIALLTPTELAQLTPTQIGGLTVVQIGSLTATQIGALTSLQIGALTATQLASLTPAQVALLTPAQLSMLSPIQMLLLPDKTPPQVTAALIPKGNGDQGYDSDEGRFLVQFQVSDNIDAQPTITAELITGGVTVTNGQLIEFEFEDEKTQIEIENGIVEIESPSMILRVTATDANGNTSYVDVLPEGLSPDNDDEVNDKDDD